MVVCVQSASPRICTIPFAKRGASARTGRTLLGSDLAGLTAGQQVGAGRNLNPRPISCYLAYDPRSRVEWREAPPMNPRQTMKSPADALPPEIARQIDPVWRKNEAAYWAVRDRLLTQYHDQWIGFAGGAVVASGSSPVAVFHAAEAKTPSPFVTCVG